MMEISLKSPYNTAERVREAALKVKQTMLNEITKEFSVNLAEQVLEITLDEDKMKLVDLTDGAVIKSIEKQIEGITLKKGEKGLLVIKMKKVEKVNDIYKLKERMKETVIAGVKGIKQVLPVKRGDEYMIMTAGTNLSEIMQMVDLVDASRTVSNDIYEIEAVLGIEAARQAIINEVMKVINEQGLKIDIRHIMLVSDTMTSSGSVKGITRYGVVGDKASVLARASFETPIKHIIQASIIGEIDMLSSVVENVMVNQPVPIGTGLPGLVTRIKKQKGE
jgi:DNA-directed RNA polymerase subunit A"